MQQESSPSEGISSQLPLNQRILRLAIPNLIAAVSVPLIGIADTAMIGHLDRVAFLGAVASASVILDVIFWGSGFLRMGTTSIIAHYHGAGDRSSCGQCLYRALLLSILVSLLVLVLRKPIIGVGFELIASSPEVGFWGREYIDIRIWSIPLHLAILVINGFFLGTANVLAPMFITFAINIVNVIADYVLIFGKWGAPQMGVTGAAYAAVLSSVVGLLMGISVLLIRYRTYLQIPIGPIFDRSKILHLLSTNANLFGRTFCLLFSQFSLLAIVSRLGEIPLAAHAIIWQIWALVSYAVDGFAHAAETLIGNKLGTLDFEGVREICCRILQWGIGIGCAFGACYFFGMNHLAGLFTDHNLVVAAVISLTLMLSVVQPMHAAVFVFDGIFIGANDVVFMFRAMLVSALVFFVPAVGLFVYGLEWGLQGAWLAYIALMVGRLVTLLHRYRGDVWLQTFVLRR